MNPITNTPKILFTPGFNLYRKKAAALECLTETANLQQTVAFSVTITTEPSKRANDEIFSDFMEERIIIPRYLPTRVNFFAGTTR